MTNRLSIGDKKITYTRKGQGPALLFLHGFMENSSIWNDYVQIFIDDYSVLAVDLPGHGGSDIWGEEMSMKEMAVILNEILIQEQLKTVSLCGHSMGGYVALAFLQEFPEKVTSLCLFHSHAGADSPEIIENRKRSLDLIAQNRHQYIHSFIPGLFAEENRSLFSKEIEQIQTGAKPITAHALSACIRGMMNRPDLTELLKNTQIPLLFIIGKKDGKLDHNMLINQVKLTKHAQSLVLEDAGHMGFIEAKQLTMGALQHFINQQKHKN